MHAVLHEIAEDGTILQQNAHANCMQQMNSGLASMKGCVFKPCAPAEDSDITR
jgi:hypothetical protein